MSEIKFQVNSRVDIVWQNKNYRSSIQDVSANYIAIASPIRERVYLPLHEGDEIEVVYYEENDTYGFTGNVIGRKFDESVQLIILAYPSVIKKVQRRNFVRVNLAHPIQYIKISENSDAREANKLLDCSKGKNGVLLDLSGGGLRVKILEKLGYGDIILTDIKMGEETIRVKGTIVRIENDGNKNDICGICFAEIDARGREKIIQLIFKIMRKQMQTV